MNRILFLSAVLSPVALCSSALARVALQEPQEPQEPQEEVVQELPSARSVIDRFLEVTKGREIVESKTSIHMSGTFTLVGMNIAGEIEVFAAKPSNFYTMIDLGSAVGVVEQGCRDEVTWRKHPMLGTSLLEGAEHYQARQQADWRAALKDASKFESMETVAREVFNDEDCHVLEFVLKAQKDQDAEKSKGVRTSREYYSTETGYLVGVSALAASPLGDSKTVAVLSDYVEVNGSMMPMKTTVKASGTTYEIHYESIEFDKVDPTVFDLPPAIQTLVETRAAKRAEAKPESEGEAGGK